MKFQLNNLLLSLLCFACTSQGSRHSTQSKDLITRVKDNVNSQVGTKAMGAMVGIYDKGEVTYLSFGPQKFNENTVFEIGSITKTFTSLLFSRAIDLGLLKKETTLGEIRPEWKKEKLGSITLIELATHRSGLPKLPCNLHYRDEKYPYADYTQNDLVMSLKDEVIAANPKCSLKDHPSSEIHYSNWGAGLLGDAIAHVAKSTYPKLLKKWITDPLGMHDTVVNLNKNQKKRLAKGYDHNLTPRGLWDRKTLDGSGAIRSTAKDLIKYAQAFLHPELIPFESSLRRVMTLEYQDEQAKIGYNWFITPTGSIWHNGMTGGYSSMIKIYLKNDFAIFNLVNTEYSLECFIAAVEEVACP